MKTQNTVLIFEKNSIIELQHEDLLSINGGSTIAGGPSCTGCMCQETEKQLEHITANNTAF